MKKGIIAILLVLGLLAAMLGGTVATVGAIGPTLTATVTLSTAPGQMTIGGTGWVPGVEVNIFIDKQDVAHQVAIVKPDATGKFLVTLTLGATTIGPHTAIAKQNGTTVNAPFTLTRVSQVDDRVYNAVDNIEQMLKDPVYGLEEIKNEVRDIGNTTDEISADVDNIETMLNSGYSGLSAIRRLVGWTERDVDQIKDVVEHVALFNSTSGYEDISIYGLGFVGYNVTGGDYAQVRHVSLTLLTGNVTGFDGTDKLAVWVEFNGTAGSVIGSIDMLSGGDSDANGVHTYEFDAQHWGVFVTVWDDSDRDVLVGWDATITWEQDIIGRHYVV